MALAPRDDRPPERQIEEHGLRQLTPEHTQKLLIVELRKLREAIYELIEDGRRRDAGS